MLKIFIRVFIILIFGVLILLPNAASAGAPITVWDTTSNPYGQSYGASFRLDGDINGDGINDFAICAHRWSSDRGRVMIYFGGSSLSATPDVTISGEVGAFRFGDGMGVGDFNGDNIDDIAFGAVRYGNPNHRGRVYLFYGRSTSAWSSINSATQAEVIITGADNSHFGNKVSIKDDMDKDGYDELLIGAEEQVDHGANLMYGGPYASLNINWNAMDVNFYNDLPYGLSSLGEDVEINDVTGDGYADAMICAGDWLGEGGDHTGFIVFFGSSTRLSGLVNASTAQTQAWGYGDYLTMGYALNSGDVNGDGIDDVITGVDKLFLSQYGKTVVFYGGAGIAGTKNAATDANVILRGEVLGDLFGMGIGIGDVNNDGIEDIVSTAYFWNVMYVGPGRLYLFFGGSGLASKTLASQADYIINNPTGYGMMGWWSNVGDLNGDGWAEFAGCASDAGLTTTTAYIFSLSHVPPVVTLYGYSGTTTTRFEGNANDPDGGNIARVQFSLDGDPWQNASPSDGAFDSPNENYYFNIRGIPTGVYTVRVRATDTENATTEEANYATARFVYILVLPETGMSIYNLVQFLM